MFNIFEIMLLLCILTLLADDWECTLGESSDKIDHKHDDSNVYSVDNLDYLQNEITNYRPQFYDSTGNLDPSKTKPESEYEESEPTAESDEESSVVMISSDSSEGSNIEVVQDLSSSAASLTADNDEDIESSGDGEELPSQSKTSFVSTPIVTEHQASVASHLQRLSQLIQSMSTAQQNGNQSNELTPNDLNAFLANYNIQTGLQDQVQPLYNSKKHQMNSDGKIPIDRLNEILRLQQKIQRLNSNDEQLFPVAPIRFQDKVGEILRPTNIDPVKSIRLKGNGLSAAQIVVNRPEGSVLFSLPNQNQPQTQPQPMSHQPPPQPQYDSESEKNYLNHDTLKAVLDLSKQLIASNNQQQQNYLQQPIFRPVYYNVPVHDLPIPYISPYGAVTQREKIKADEEPVDDIEKTTPAKGIIVASNDDRTTVIHNHIPITIQNRKAVKPTTLPAASDHPVTDSYGEKVLPELQQSPSQVPYPPFNDPPFSSVFHSPTVNSAYPQYQPLPQNPNYPNYQPSVTNPNYQQYQSSAANPSYQQYQLQSSNPIYQQYQPNYYNQPQPPFSPYSQQIYPTNPHLSELNVNSYVHVNTPAYPTLTPATASAPPPTGYPQQTYADQIFSPERRPPSGQPVYVDDVETNAIRYGEGDIENDVGNTVDNSEPNALEELDLDMNDENVTNVLSLQSQRPNSADSNASNLESKQSLEYHQSRPSSINSAGSISLNNDSPFINKNHKNAIVHYGSTYMTYDDYQQSVAPLLSKGGTQTLEVLSCVTGARQPNSADCAKYFVCNAVTQKVLDYTCPQFTAFNQESRFCDAKTYADCKGTTAAKPVVTVDANRLNQLAAQQAQQDLVNAHRIQANAIQNQQLTAQLNQQSQFLLNQQRPAARPTTQRAPMAIAAPTRRPQMTVTTTTKRPRRRMPIRRIIKCSEPTKVHDSLSVFNYFTCFKGADGKLKALKQTCPNGLVFCERMKMCTSRERC